MAHYRKSEFSQVAMRDLVRVAEAQTIARAAKVVCHIGCQSAGLFLGGLLLRRLGWAAQWPDHPPNFGGNALLSLRSGPEASGSQTGRARRPALGSSAR